MRMKTLLYIASSLNQSVKGPKSLKFSFIKNTFLDSSCIQQLRQNEPLIRIPPNTVEISATVLTYFAKTFLSQFFPQSDSLLIEALADNISTTIMGLYISCDGCMRCDNLLDQWEKEFFIFHTEKIKSYYNQTYPDMTTLGPLHLEVCLHNFPIF